MTDKPLIRNEVINSIFTQSGLQDNGFTLSKLGIYKKQEDYLFGLSFGTAISANRVEGTNILQVRAYVKNSGFRQFQQEKLKLSYLEGIIGTGLIDNLFKQGPPYIRYDVGIERTQIIHQSKLIISSVQKYVFRFFELSSNFEQLLQNIHLPCFLPIERKLEYLLFLDRVEEIEEMLNSLIKYYGKELELKIIEYSYKMRQTTNLDEVLKETYGDMIKVMAGKIAKRMIELNIDTAYNV